MKEELEKLHDRVDKIEKLLLKIESQNKKILNINSDSESLDTKESYGKVVELANRKGKVPTDVAEKILPVNSKQAVLRHMRKIVDNSDQLVFQEGKGNKSAKIRHEKTVLASGKTKSESSGREPAAAKSWLGG